MHIILYNTLTRKKEIFKPINEEKIGLYVCGPTVYDPPHIGNARSIIVYDILYRVISYIYKKENITYVRNITDLDDKINLAAKKRNIPIKELTDEITKIFHDNAKSLNCLPPTIEPRATDHLKEMISIIEILLEKNIAYIGKNNSVYFDVSKYSDYGSLAGRKIEELRSGARLEFDEEKINQEDFVLWKKADIEDDPSSIFPSPWCDGRPGWHIECSAMSVRYLGKDFDIHGGGADLMFPHHTNEIAQTCGAFPESKFAKFWIHNGFVTVNGKKMSKSEGNFITVNDLINNNIKGEYIRYALISTIYSKPLNWTNQLISDAKINLDKIYRLINFPEYNLVSPIEDPEFMTIITNDLNSPNALVYLNSLANKLANKDLEKSEKLLLFSKIKFTGDILGILQNDPKKWFEDEFVIPSEIQEKFELRNQARSRKDWELSDKLREEIEEKGFIIEDGEKNIIRKK